MSIYSKKWYAVINKSRMNNLTLNFAVFSITQIPVTTTKSKSKLELSDVKQTNKLMNITYLHIINISPNFNYKKNLKNEKL